MGIGSFAVQLIFVFLLTTFLLNKYGNWRKQHLIVSISTFIGWYFSFLIILLLPLDISITFYEKCLLEEARVNNSTDGVVQNISMGCEQPKGYVSESFLLSFWRIVYWTSQLLTWIVLPIMQSYSKAGEFTTLGRLKSALYNNLIYYGTYGFTFLFLLIYAISKGVSLSFDHLKVLVVSSSNTWGLFLLVMLLGYGLVEVPRQLCQMGSREYRLNKTYFDIDHLSTDKNDAEETIQEVYREAREVMNMLKSTRGNAREKSQQIMSKFPYELSKELSSSKSLPNFGNASNISESDASAISNDAYLIRLHKRVIDAVQNHHRCQAQWHALVSKALYLEDVELAEATRQLPPNWTVPAGWRRQSSVRMSKNLSMDLLNQFSLPHSVRYAWHVTFKRSILQLLGAICTVMTLLIMWSECTFFIIHPQLSLAARILHGLAIGYHYKYIQITAILLIFYLGVCAYYTIFRMRIYRYYHLDPHKMTDENSLIFSAMLFCRLTPPMCLNFLGMIHLDSHITSDAKFGVETQFTRLMGHLDVIPLLAKGINIYLPILIVLLCLATWLKLGTRLLHSLGIDQFLDDDDQMTAGMVQNGKALVTLERNRINRERGREERNRAWASRAQANAKSKKSKAATLGRTEYSDREPIMEHQDNAMDEELSIGIDGGEEEDLIFSSRTFQKEIGRNSEKEVGPKSAQQPSLADLEFGSAFDRRTFPAESSSKMLDVGGCQTAQVESSKILHFDEDAIHPTPSSIFDDL